jgi:hypothetical protein
MLTAEQTYQRPLKKVRQGDLALCEFHQLRARSGEPRGPGESALANEDIPYFGPYSDYELEISVAGGGHMTRILRVWAGYAMVIHQNCEIEYAADADSRMLVAPIVSKPNWPTGPWDLIAARALPSYFHLPPLDAEQAAAVGLDGAWPESAVVFASATALSRGIVKPNRVLALSPRAVPGLQETLVRFSTVRGWASHSALEGLIGKTIVAVEQTPETVPGPAPLAKVFLADGEENDEITVAWGVRRTGKA